MPRIYTNRGRFRLDPWEYDRQTYKRRNEVERLFRRLEGFRRIFSRFEKLDVSFLGFVVFALISNALRWCEHALARILLPPIHKDPFDRILGAQARSEGVTLSTSDEVVGRCPGTIRVLTRGGRGMGSRSGR